MRMSTGMIYQQNMSGISNNQSMFMRAGQQLTTGKKVINPSDDPLAASNAVMLGQSQAENTQFMLARTFARQSISMEETVLSAATSTISDIKALIVSAGGTESDDDRVSLASKLQGLKDELLNHANSTDGNGRYLFAGYKNDRPPFVTDNNGIVSYQGGDTAVHQKVDANRTMTIGHTGNSVFMALTSNPKPEPDGSPSVSDIFESIDIALEALKTPLANASDADRHRVNDAMAKANRGMDNSYNNILSVRSELGNQLKEMDQLDNIGKDREMSTKLQMSDLTDADFVEAISTYYLQQTTLQAAYKTFNDMQSMSLFQMHR